MIPYGKQDINQEDIDAVIEVLKSDFITQGPSVPLFEKTLQNHTTAKYGIAVNSATSALHIACLALGVGKGDLVWTSPITFVASANCALYCGAEIDFVDIDSKTYNMCPGQLELKLRAAKKANKPTPKFVIPVHLCGQPCEMEKIAALANEFNFRIIEDASHAIGGKYQGKPIGNCQYSDITVFSFHPVKIITTAEGGMAMTNNVHLADKMALLRSHGTTRDTDQMTEKTHGPWYYQQIELGFNYRLTDIQAALGISQVKRLNQFVNTRHQLANRYNKLLHDLPVITPYQHKDAYSAFHLYVINLDHKKLNKTHKQVFEKMRDLNIGINLHYIPVHMQPYYQKFGYKVGDFPNAENYYASAMSLPLYTQLEHQQQDQVVEALIKSLS